MADRPFNPDVTASGIANRTGVQDALHEAVSTDRQLHDTKEQSKNISDSNKQQQDIMATFTPEQKKYLSEVYGVNLAKTNPLGNLNNMSGDQTLAASRKADAYNNSVRFLQGDIGARTFTMGNTGISDPRLERVSPIETQEMRQMRANERIDEKARGRQADLAADIEQHGLEMQRQKDSNLMQLAQAYGMNNPAMEQQIRQMTAQLMYMSPAQIAQTLLSSYYANQLQAVFGHELASYYHDFMQTNPSLAVMCTQYMGMGLPTYAQRMIDQQLTEYIKQHPNMSPDAKNNLYNTLKFVSDSTRTAISMNGFNAALWSGTRGDRYMDSIDKYSANSEANSYDPVSYYQSLKNEATAKKKVAKDAKKAEKLNKAKG